MSGVLPCNLALNAGSTNTETITVYSLQPTRKHSGVGQNVTTTALPEEVRPATAEDKSYLDERYAFSGGPTFVYQKQLTTAELVEGITFDDLRDAIIGVIG